MGIGVGGEVVYKVLNSVAIMRDNTQFFPLGLSGGMDFLVITALRFFPVGGGETASVSTVSGVLGVSLWGRIGVLVIGERAGTVEGAAGGFEAQRRAARISRFCSLMQFSVSVCFSSRLAREG